MQNNVSIARKGPQLTPEIQAKIGQQLRKYYDDVVGQGVPNRFVDLLDRLEAPGGDAVKSAEMQNDSNRVDEPSTKHSNTKQSNKESR